MNTIIVSDLHLGARNSRTDQIARLLDSNFERLLLNGDTVDSPDHRLFGERDWQVVETLRAWVPGKTVRISLAGHSGGGSFLFGFIDGADAIPDWVDRVAFLDANYSYADADKHGDKLLAWLKGDRARRLVVISYDDRNITLNGRPVVGPDGGTFRATERMRKRFAKDVTFAEATSGGMLSAPKTMTTNCRYCFGVPGSQRST